MEIHLLPWENGHVVVSEVGVFALGSDADAANALGRELYGRLRVPVVPLVVGKGSGYRHGVLHVASLEGHLSGLPRVLSPQEVQALKEFLEGGCTGEPPRVSPRVPKAPSPAQEGGVAQKVEPKVEAPPLPKRVWGWTSALLVALLLPLLVAFLFPGGAVLLPLALWMVAVQDRLLRQGGASEEWMAGFGRVLWGLLALAFVGGVYGFPPHVALAGGLAWVLLPGLYGALSLYRPLPYGQAALLYLVAWADALWGVALLFPLVLLSPYPWLSLATLVPLGVRLWLGLPHGVAVKG
ncbi:hypothetical protein [Thermus caldifontis]|uniref:hypothetical protein n=1 Tax=Thermus caldifontis TaxID=1930763 RepID=UPI000DF40E70|nr:hypothetical protein [Thermus caldifontis]